MKLGLEACGSVFIVATLLHNCKTIFHGSQADYFIRDDANLLEDIPLAFRLTIDDYLGDQ
eukprot:711688-Hanusia_phi.AAC.1